MLKKLIIILLAALICGSTIAQLPRQKIILEMGTGTW
jgi:hypothetical protein